jgi:hypothetical protein
MDDTIARRAKRFLLPFFPEFFGMSDILMHVGGDPVFIDYDEDGMEHVYWNGEMTVDADGSPRAYGPSGCQPPPLDWLENAGYPGNWWGIATDSGDYDGNPVLQKESDPYPGLYVSTTAYVHKGYDHTDPRRYVDSEKVLFSVVPGNVRKATKGICKGCKCRVTDKKKKLGTVYCVIADIGPSDHLGEGSMALCVHFKLNPNPKKGGSSDKTRFQYEIWPGVAAEGFQLQS